MRCQNVLNSTWKKFTLTGIATVSCVVSWKFPNRNFWLFPISWHDGTYALRNLHWKIHLGWIFWFESKIFDKVFDERPFKIVHFWRLVSDESLLNQIIDSIKRFAKNKILQQNNVIPSDYIPRFFFSFLHPTNRAKILDDSKKSFGFDVSQADGMFFLQSVIIYAFIDAKK